MNRLFVLFLFMVFTLAGQSGLAQQKKGKYIPTKYDTVKKVVPEQYYGNPKAKRIADSIAKEEALLREREQKEQEALEKARKEQKALEEKNKKATQNKPVVAPKGNRYDQRPINRPPVKAAQKPQPQKPPVQKPPVRPTVKPKPATMPKPVAQSQRPKPPKLIREKWTLAECIAYAKENNLQVAESVLDERMEKLILEQTKSSRYPDLMGDILAGRNFGRNIDPVTNQFVNGRFNYSTMGLSSSTLLFGWFQKKYQQDKNKLDAEAASLAASQIQDEIALNLANGFLRVVMARELQEYYAARLKSFKQQRGINPRNTELFELQTEAGIAEDSAAYISARSDEMIALLQLKALMNFDFEQKFDIIPTENYTTDIEKFYSIAEPESLVQKALNDRQQIQYHQLKLRSAKKSLDVAKAMQYPRLSLYGNVGTVYSSNIQNITGQTYEGESPAGYVNIGGSTYPVTHSQYNYTTSSRPMFDQYGDHIRAGAGLGLSIPLLNGSVVRTGIQKAKIDLVRAQIHSDREKLKLKQDIYKSYEESKTSVQQYFSYKKSVNLCEKSFESIQEQFNNGMITLADYRAAMQVCNKTYLNAISAKYVLWFHLKMLDYHIGNPIKL